MRTLWIVALVFVTGCVDARPTDQDVIDEWRSAAVQFRAERDQQRAAASAIQVAKTQGDQSILPADGFKAFQIHIATPATKAQLLQMLRDLPPNALLLVGYAGADGNFHHLSEADLWCNQP